MFTKCPVPCIITQYGAFLLIFMYGGNVMSICAVVLAAGLSVRMGEDKLIMPYDGMPLGEHILKNIKENSTCFSQVLVVGRLQQTRAAAERFGYVYIHNDEPERGMGHSLALGAMAAGECDGFFVALSDMPMLKSGTVYALCRAFEEDPGRIAVPVYGGRRGNPVIFPASFRAELSALSGEHGGRDIIKRESGRLLRVQAYDAGILRDIDTRADIEK